MQLAGPCPDGNLGKTEVWLSKPRRDPPVAVTSTLTGQRDDASVQRIFIDSLDRQVTVPVKLSLYPFDFKPRFLPCLAFDFGITLASYAARIIWARDGHEKERLCTLERKC